MRILVNNIKSTNSTLLVRLLKRIKKIPIEVLGSDVYEPGFIASSIFVDKYIKSPNIDNETEYLVFLNNLSEKYKIDFLFVSTDKEVRFIDKISFISHNDLHLHLRYDLFSCFYDINSGWKTQYSVIGGSLA